MNANARLISAAPDLLKVVSDLVRAVEAGEVWIQESGISVRLEEWDWAAEWLHNARSALAKARGETP